MPASACEYALIRVVPRVERGEFINVGVLLLCRQRRFLATCLRPNEARLHAFAPELDHPALRQQLDMIALVCNGGPQAGPIGALLPHERFRWLTAPRSTIVQTSPVHVGLYSDPQAALERICQQMVS